MYEVQVRLSRWIWNGATQGRIQSSPQTAYIEIMPRLRMALYCATHDCLQRTALLQNLEIVRDRSGIRGLCLRLWPMAEVTNLAEAWEDACTRVETNSGRHIDRAREKPLEEIYAQLERSFDKKDEKKGHEHQKLQTAARETFQLLKLLGGIAAQGVSVVFGPANICFNALSFLIDVPSKVSEFSANLKALFEEIRTSFLQFGIYGDIEKSTAIESALLKITHMVMISFADICAVAIKFFSGNSFTQLVRKTKVVILDSGSELKSKLEEFRRLTDRQNHISNAISLKNILEGRNENQIAFAHLNEIAEGAMEKMLELMSLQADVKNIQGGVDIARIGVEALTKDMNEKNTKSKDREDFEKLCKRLVRKSEPEHPSRQFESTILQFQDMGLWCRKTEAYEEWASPEKSFAPILLIKGAGSSGKSTLASALMDDFRPLSGENDNLKTVWNAFYQFPKQAKKDRLSALQDAIRSIAAQLSESNIVIRERLRKTLDSNPSHLLGDADVFVMFRTIFPGSGDRDESNMSFVIVFDAIDQLSDRERLLLFKAIEKVESAQVRSMLAGDNDILPDDFEEGTRSARWMALRFEKRTRRDAPSPYRFAILTHTHFMPPNFFFPTFTCGL